MHMCMTPHISGLVLIDNDEINGVDLSVLTVDLLCLFSGESLLSLEHRESVDH